MRLQRTIQRPAAVRGLSLISGLDVVVRFCPAPENSGLHFVRVDLSRQPVVPATLAHRIDCPRRTVLERNGVRVEMTEHVLAALRGLGIDNCRIEISAPETPGCDGSALQFARALLDAGSQLQSAWTEPLVVQHPVCVCDGRSFIAALPNPHGYMDVDYTLDYRATCPHIGRHRFECHLTVVNFLAEIAPSRTFLLEAEAHALRKQGWGQRTTPRDLLIYTDTGPMENVERYPDEPARHKALDMIGDLALLGTELVASVVGYRSGHRLNAALADALLTWHGREAPLRIQEGAPLWPAVLSVLPSASGIGEQYVLSPSIADHASIGLGAVVLAAWHRAACALGRAEQLTLVEFLDVAIDAIPEPTLPFRTAVAQLGAVAIEIRIVQRGRLLGAVRTRAAEALARAA